MKRRETVFVRAARGDWTFCFIFCVLLEKTPRRLFEVCAEVEGRGEGAAICSEIHQGERLQHRSFKHALCAYRQQSNGEGLPPPQHSTEAAVEESQRIFSKLIRAIEKQSNEVKEVMRVQERAAVGQAEELLEKIQREMVELRRADAELERISRTEDHSNFFQVDQISITKEVAPAMHSSVVEINKLIYSSPILRFL